MSYYAIASLGPDSDTLIYATNKTIMWSLKISEAFISTDYGRMLDVKNNAYFIFKEAKIIRIPGQQLFESRLKGI